MSITKKLKLQKKLDKEREIIIGALLEGEYLLERNNGRSYYLDIKGIKGKVLFQPEYIESGLFFKKRSYYAYVWTDLLYEIENSYFNYYLFDEDLTKNILLKNEMTAVKFVSCLD